MLFLRSLFLKFPFVIDEVVGKKAFCTCGISLKQPYCDGSHKGTEYKPFVYKAELTKRVFFCACKQTNDQPFCDGSHNKK